MKDVFSHGEEAGCLPKDGFNSKSDEEGGQKSQKFNDIFYERPFIQLKIIR